WIRDVSRSFTASLGIAELLSCFPLAQKPECLKSLLLCFLSRNRCGRDLPVQLGFLFVQLTLQTAQVGLCAIQIRRRDALDLLRNFMNLLNPGLKNRLKGSQRIIV